MQLFFEVTNLFFEVTDMFFEVTNLISAGEVTNPWCESLDQFGERNVIVWVRGDLSIHDLMRPEI
jgi:hypothetical protein